MLKKIIGAIAFFAIFSTLIYLGVWQLQRLTWKTQIIQSLELEYAKNPLEHNFTFKELTSLGNETLPLKNGHVIGKFIHDKEIYLGPKTENSLIGYHIITPLKLAQGYILINRGWIAESDMEHDSLPQPQGIQIISGLIRKPDWNRFTPQNSPSNNIWMRPDINQIAESMALSPVAPVMLYQQATPWYPRNKHQQYALFWLTLAIIWGGFGVFLTFFRKQ